MIAIIIGVGVLVDLLLLVTAIILLNRAQTTQSTTSQIIEGLQEPTWKVAGYPGVPYGDEIDRQLNELMDDDEEE